ncbi:MULTISPECIES: polysaccharide pyruvyl transferase family protein [Bosea]|uniref:polysaccharide pyruvyl transferase family protein n=1 Tax=Bosea TaxID=85413 RepID=UPI00214FEA98|nr:MULTISPECIES: polysaccharide pyruvyl transferase family protein [Bosea]MCR4522275.1 polysaccharide pyruvyl transferase family protein [Bosea sp. 47.2.35]MDR6828072.1 polysaccharide pyruvyl transferase WcaK-like protein [Bosea robiniae]MDR6894778.1 polysaccharide pyruvyl transferase WcaK-like protein [Bosea sp. BE109]MDR7138178.1 polysaccharide pyruvyl transferase WcaK-like protein [Bosea sp. BE168]MDR7174877.1 polysaccharide pyruvyl transferase WcaK-like protein [Bosea sp. BE271]
MARILVISPSGEVYDHDNVRWYRHADLQSHIEHYHNIGDAFVFDSSLKLLNFEKLDELPIDRVDPAMIDRLNAEYDYVFLRGSNYVHAQMNWSKAAEVLRRLKIPVIAFGIGAQAPVSGKLELSEDTKTVLKLIADSTASLGVRGTYSAEVLNDLGIRNVRIIGCPTAFRNNDPNLAIRLPPLEQVKTAGVTLRREVSKTYAQDIKRYLTFHRSLVKAMADRFEVTLMSQGEVEEKKLALGTIDQQAQAMTALRANEWANNWYLDEQVERLYQTRMFYSDVVAEYERLVRGLDLVLGYRLHGNLMALANGTPSIYFTYDSRTVEFADTFKIPSVDVFAGQDFRLEEYWEQARFDRFNAAYGQVYSAMSAFLSENKVDHKMVRRAAVAQEAPAPERKVA